MRRAVGVGSEGYFIFWCFTFFINSGSEELVFLFVINHGTLYLISKLLRNLIVCCLFQVQYKTAGKNPLNAAEAADKIL